MRQSLQQLIKGYQRFFRSYRGKKYDAYRETATLGQRPKVMVISCSDSRVPPSILMRSGLGEVFTVCNVANLVPPYCRDTHTHHGTSAALEFGVGALEVEHIVVMGHSGCGGIRALVDGSSVALDGEYSFIAPWVAMMQGAKQEVQHLPRPEQYHACELASLRRSLRNLRSFPWIEERVSKGTLVLHAWHFDIGSGVMSRYDEAQDAFVPLIA